MFKGGCNWVMYNKYEFQSACYIGEKIIFKYDSKSYCIDKTQDDKLYLLNMTTNNYQYFDNPEKLINKGLIEKCYLFEILDDIEITFIEFNTKKEFIAATKMNREIEFDYNGVNYFKSSDDKGYYIWCEKDNSRQYYSSPDELLEKGKLEDKPLKDLWDEINIHFLF